MIPNGIARYESVKITTATPGDVLVSLFDGLFKFLHVARHSMNSGDRARAGISISKAHAIISELMLSLDDRHAADLCKNLRSIYDFCLFRLTQANRHNQIEGIDEVLRVLAPIREAFTAAVRQVAATQTLQPTGSGG